MISFHQASLSLKYHFHLQKMGMEDFLDHKAQHSKIGEGEWSSWPDYFSIDQYIENLELRTPRYITDTAQ